jgi:hypothetical protein
MVNPRWRPLIYSLAALALIWAVAMAGYTIARNARVTPEKIRAYVAGTDFAHLSHADRASAIDKLARMLNSLSLEERRKARLDGVAWRWFNDMTEEEKSSFIEATMPTGFKQMLTAFEQLPEEKRHKAIDDTLRRVREARAKDPSGSSTNRQGTNAPVLSPELEAKMRSIGLQTFYSQSSAQTKAELAPVMEELQHSMESGRALRGR